MAPTCNLYRLHGQQIVNSFSRFISLSPFASSLSGPFWSTRYSRRLRCHGILVCIYTIVRTRCASTNSVWRVLNDVERIDKVDRLKSIMLGNYREELALVTVQLNLWLRNVLVKCPRFLHRSLIQSLWKRRLNMY